MNFTVKLADMALQLDSHTDALRDFFRDYLCQSEHPELSFTWTDKEITSEQDSFEVEYSTSYLETLAALRKISEEFPLHKRMLIHGASIAYHGKGYLFTAPSGTGKSTHIKLWRKHIGSDVQIINGDKPFLSLADTVPRIYGSPWAGKENWHANRSFPLSGICIVQRGTENSIRRLDSGECITLLLRQIFMPSNPEAVIATLDLTDALLSAVPVYLLHCDMSEDAVRCSFEALTGETYPSN